MASDSVRSLTLSNLNPDIRAMESPILEPLHTRAMQIEEELLVGVQKPFKDVIRANIGCCHGMGQKPITFLRQVLALITYPPLMESSAFPEDAKIRARTFLSACRSGSIGSYTESPGIKLVREGAAKFIEKRDGCPSDWQNVFLTSGAAEGIKSVLKLLKCQDNGKKPGVMVPVPQYSLYSALLTEAGMERIPYYLDEEHQWSLDISQLQKSIDEAKNYCFPRAIVVINPGNPTSQVLSRENVEEVVRFAHKNKLYILADEVYQGNIHNEELRFYSFKKVIFEMEAPYSATGAASFMSASKGFLGECGMRGAYVEVANMCPKVREEYAKTLILSLCPNIYGQAALYVSFNEPAEGEPSYELFQKEKAAILSSLKSRARMIQEAFNKFEGFECNQLQGAMYAFPKIELPPKAIQAAEAAGVPPDVFYATELLENAGVLVVPGEGCDKERGTCHVRSTILPQPEKLKEMLERFHSFHKKFMDRYR